MKFLDDPHKWDGKWYGTFEFRSPCSTNECNFVYNPSAKRFEEIDEIAFGEWWDWDLNNLDEHQKEYIKEMYPLIEDYISKKESAAS